MPRRHVNSISCQPGVSPIALHSAYAGSANSSRRGGGKFLSVENRGNGAVRRQSRDRLIDIAAQEGGQTSIRQGTVSLCHSYKPLVRSSASTMPSLPVVIAVLRVLAVDREIDQLALVDVVEVLGRSLMCSCFVPTQGRPLWSPLVLAANRATTRFALPCETTNPAAPPSRSRYRDCCRPTARGGGHCLRRRRGGCWCSAATDIRRSRRSWD